MAPFRHVYALGRPSPRFARANPSARPPWTCGDQVWEPAFRRKGVSSTPVTWAKRRGCIWLLRRFDEAVMSFTSMEGTALICIHIDNFGSTQSTM